MIKIAKYKRDGLTVIIAVIRLLCSDQAVQRNAIQARQKDKLLHRRQRVSILPCRNRNRRSLHIGKVELVCKQFLGKIGCLAKLAQALTGRNTINDKVTGLTLGCFDGITTHNYTLLSTEKNS